MFKIKALYTFLLSFFAITAFSQNPESQTDSVLIGAIKQPVYYAYRLTTTRPDIDGKLNDECWSKNGIWADKWRQLIPNEGDKTTYPTAMKILYDDKNIYVAMRCYDS